MTNYSVNIEDAPKLGILDCINEGYLGLIRNFKTFLKISIAPIINFLMVYIMLLPAFILGPNANFVESLICLLWLVICMPVYVYVFWQALLSVIAISYFAKDVYEHKPIQKASTYYAYVKYHGTSYIKYLLWASLFCLIITVISAAVFIFEVFYLENRALSFATIIILTAISILIIAAYQFGQLYWAYNDKTNSLNVFIKGFIKGMENSLKVLLLIIIWNFGLILPVVAIKTVINAVFSTLVYNPVILYNTTDFIVGLYIVIVGCTSTFVLTRYYFSIMKK